MSGSGMGTPGKYKDPFWWVITICLVAVVVDLALHSNGILKGPVLSGVAYAVFGLACVFAAIRKQTIGFRPMTQRNSIIMLVLGIAFVALGIVWIVVNPLGM